MIYRTTLKQLKLTALLIFLAAGARAQNTLDNVGLGAGATASAAYSTRRLSSSYSGNALRVRRSSDNTVSDIGFTAGGDLDVSTLMTFVGSSDGFVTAWYDQSGHGLDLTQADPTHQPALVSSGTLSQEGSRPFIRFLGNGGTDYRSLNLATEMTTVGHVSALIRFSATGDGFILSHQNDYFWHSETPNHLINSTYASNSVQTGNAWSNGMAYSPVLTPWPTSLTIAELEPATPATETSWDNIGSDRNQYHSISLGGGYGELIVFPAALSTSDRQALENNEGAYFSGTLPVTWLSFTARLADQAVLLQWQTASEQNAKDFKVQYSPDGSSWTSLTTLPAAGNSSTIRTYNYARSNPPAGDNYYRILQTDLDGNAHYSSINLVKIPGRQEEFKLLQNPVTTGMLQISINTSTTLQLFTMDGKLLWKRKYDPGTAEIRLNGYAKGAYILAGKTTSTQLLIK